MMWVYADDKMSRSPSVLVVFGLRNAVSSDEYLRSMQWFLCWLVPYHHSFFFFLLVVVLASSFFFFFFFSVVLLLYNDEMDCQERCLLSIYSINFINNQKQQQDINVVVFISMLFRNAISTCYTLCSFDK